MNDTETNNPEETEDDGIPMIVTGGPDGKMVSRPATPEEIRKMSKMRVRVNDDGTQTLTNPKTGEELTIDPARLDEYESPARRRLKQLCGESQAKRVERVEIEGEEWFVKRLNFGELTRLGLLTPRQRDGLLDMSQADNLTALTAAMLFCCMVTDEAGQKEFFESLAEAHDWATSPDTQVRGIVSNLFNAILTANPDIIPGANTGENETPEEKGAREKKDASATSEENEKEPSSTPPQDNPANGGTASGSTATLASLPGDTGDGADSNATGAAT